MSSLLSRLTGLAPPRESGKERAAEIKPGRVVKATVLSAREDRATVRIAGQTLEARTETPLRAGQVLDLKALKTGGQMVFSVVDKPAGGGGLRLALAELAGANLRLAADMSTVLEYDSEANPPQSAEARQALQDLRQLAGQAVFAPGEKADPEALRRSLEASGRSWEARAAAGGPGQAPPTSLKTLARLLSAALGKELASMLPGEGDGRGRALRGLLEASNGLRRWAESSQKLNAEMFPRQALLLLSLPIFLGQRLDHAELLLDLAAKGGARDENSTRIVFLLKMSHLGDLLVEAELKGMHLEAEFVVSDPEKAAFLDRELPLLQKALGSLGYSSSLNAAVRSGQDLMEASPLARLMRDQGGYFSVMV